MRHLPDRCLNASQGQADIRCFEITIGRRLYDDTNWYEEPEIEKHSQTVKEATLSSGRVFSEQLAEVVAICSFCEEHCLGKSDGPSRIPPYQFTTRDP